ncbi:RNase P/RNase MRP complex subunit [Aspergillus saccharolyticus JOP 1030-1]|uniref:Ribonuclease P protein subunit n=1 Tax=Aspergillus saccharolyticus JOP 1030-1 TaxID=1450539 RepID=A0A319A604_9EURO|nr:RNase P/MRP, p29 subunit [Aspergillus saccharolyticus JOP 1030-1]PYH42822.1 RNase P/MRP, p29 subunit [Aspergillus saccharolyticus JOP 1030-1]
MSTQKQHIAHTLLLRAHSPDTAATLFTERIKQKPLYVRPTSPTPEDNRQRRRLHRLRRKEYFLRKQKPRPLSAREKRENPGTFGVPLSTKRKNKNKKQQQQQQEEEKKEKHKEEGTGTGTGNVVDEESSQQQQKKQAEEYKYATFQQLHKLWVEYMVSVLDLGGKTGAVVTPSSHGSKLVSCDYHGAEVEVVRSRCAGRVGLRGVVVRDGMFAFTVVMEGDRVVVIPKEHTVFRFCLPLPSSRGDGDGKEDGGEEKKLVFELHGSQFQNRPVDRANKKFKWRNVDYV